MVFLQMVPFSMQQIISLIDNLQACKGRGGASHGSARGLAIVQNMVFRPDPPYAKKGKAHD
jgi:hypothetical protein